MSALCHRTELQPAVAVRESDVLAPVVSSCIWFIVTLSKKKPSGCPGGGDEAGCVTALITAE